MPGWVAGRRGAVIGVALAVAVVAGAVFVTWPRSTSGPDLSQVPPEALAPDLEALTPDGDILDDELAHDSRDDTYRQPFGAVPAGTDVTLRLRAAAGDLEEATIRVYDALAESQVLVPMEVVARDATAGTHGYDYWEAVLPTTNIPSVLYYRFIVRDGGAVRYVEDDSLLDGGMGQTLLNSPDRSWQLVTYDPSFETPDWARGALAYQIFPDRFANGDPANDPSPDAQPAAEGGGRYRYGDVYGNPVLTRDWEADLPEGYCRAYTRATDPCAEEPLGRDFYGGDLAGIRQHLPELAELGVTVLYLNPVFAAPSNHRYDTSDYTVIDPDLGTQADLEALVADAEAVGMRVVLDGVFNHTSSDSPFFDRNARFPEVGACESADSEWAAWYVITPGPPAKCHDGTTYEDWFGFDTLAVLAENPTTFDYFLAPESIATRWLDSGIGGWRLDVMNEISHGFLRGLRNSVKEADPEALILGEEWGDASAWLLGTEVDSVMNYRFRRAVIGLINGETADADGAIGAMTPSTFARTMEGVREDYPPAAWDVLHNLVDSHDTTRILWTLTPGDDNREAKESPEALAVGKARLRLLAALQLTWPGMAGVYYGTEAGLTGHDDPDDRRPYPWSAIDAELFDSYATLGQLRAAHAVFRTGDLTFLLADDEAGTLAFGRRTDTEAAITVLNLTDAPRTVTIPTAGWIPDGVTMADALGESSVTTTADGVTVDLPGYGSAVLLADPGMRSGGAGRPGRAQRRGIDRPSSRSRWNAVEDATSYRVWRSMLAGGGYRMVAAVEDGTSFDDPSVRNGTRVHYVVTAVDAAGNESGRSPEATALPEVVVAEARLTSDARDRAAALRGRAGPSGGRDRPRTAVQRSGRPDRRGPHGARVRARGRVGHRRRRGLDVGADDLRRRGGRRRPLDRVGAPRGGGELSRDGAPVDGWRSDVARGLGSSESGRRSAGRRLLAVAADDATAPSAPGGLVATSVAETGVSLAWDAVSDDDLHRYEILRSRGDGELERIGVATEPAFTDDSVSGGQTYTYAVRAQDTSYNRSDPSAAIEVGAAAREVAVTFTVSVPANTTATDSVFIAGDFQGWDPGGTAMTRIDDTTWEITLTFPEATPLQYKYTRGSWEAVEKDAGCGEIPNRELTVQHGTEGALAQADEVAKWRDLDNCP